jgi:hypothetical protein
MFIFMSSSLLSVFLSPFFFLFEGKRRRKKKRIREREGEENSKKNCSVPSFSFARSFAYYNWHENGPWVVDKLHTHANNY